MEKITIPSVSIRRIEGMPPQFAEGELARIALAYAEVFAGEPWKEVSKCEDGFSAEPVGSWCEECNAARSEAYPLEEQMETIAAELSRPGSACFVLEDDDSGEVVGFSWGFAYNNVDEFLEEKYKGEGAEYDQTRETVRRCLGSVAIGGGPFYYLSETGIKDDPRYRGRGFSKELNRRRMEVAFNELGLDVVQRTSSKSMMANTMRSAGLTQVMGADIGEPDMINPQRVLFAKKYKGGSS